MFSQGLHVCRVGRGHSHPVSVRIVWGHAIPWHTALPGGVLGLSLTAVTAALAVGLDVFAEVVTSHEPLVADWTSKTFLAAMGAEMPLQLVRASKPLSAEQPVAYERSFSCMPA